MGYWHTSVCAVHPDDADLVDTKSIDTQVRQVEATSDAGTDGQSDGRANTEVATTVAMVRCKSNWSSSSGYARRDYL